MRKAFIYLFFLIGIGCKKDFLDVNTNPNNPPFAPIGLVLPNALNVTASRQVMNYTFISGWMQQWAISSSFAPSSSDFTTYKQTTDFGNGLWLGIYDNLEDYDSVEIKATIQNKPFYEATAKIMKAYNFQQLVDMFGDIPYTDALKGTLNLRPAYQDGQLIYDSLIIELDTAISLMQRSDAKEDEGGDILFNGSQTSWIKFANSLKLRILMRQSEIPGKTGYIKDEISKIMNGSDGFIASDVSVNPGYYNEASKQNTFYSNFYNSRGTYINAFWVANQNSIDFYKDNKDPRLTAFYTKSLDQVYRGNVLGLSLNSRDSCSKFGPGVLKSSSQPAILMLLAESYFLQAEAMQRGYMSGSAKDLYNSGVIESFNFLDAVLPPIKSVIDPEKDSVTFTSIQSARYYLDSSYFPDSSVNPKKNNWNNAQDKIKLIITQKWAAENCVTPFEEWCDYRRTGFPDVALTRSPFVDVKAIPVRILYPSSEYQTNASNIPPQSSNAHHTEKLFWMP